jgi:hypothetical protein
MIFVAHSMGRTPSVLAPQFRATESHSATYFGLQTAMEPVGGPQVVSRPFLADTRVNADPAEFLVS